MVSSCFDIDLSHASHEVLGRVAVSFRHMMVLLVAPQLADAPLYGAEDAAMGFGVFGCAVVVDESTLR